MATQTRPSGKLRISRCHCETGRQRYHLPNSIRISFDNPNPLVPPLVGGQADQEEDGDEDLEVEDFGLDEPEDEDEDEGDGDNLTGQEGVLHPIGFVEDDAEALQIVQDLQDLPLIPTNVDEDDEDEDFDGLISESQDSDTETERQRIPRIATWRLNLTALSQKYNLYFVAYRDKIHVSRPRSCVTHNLPPVPDLILRPEASPTGRRVGGAIDPEFPHQVNHLIVGDLGEEEILLVAYDDGDVVGFYTRHIEDYLVRRRLEPSLTMCVRPFFHENVGKSAWGLAVHQKSRLIAVGSNSHDVSLFVFALAGRPFRSDSFDAVFGIKSPIALVPPGQKVRDEKALFRTMLRPEDEALQPSWDCCGPPYEGLERMASIIGNRDANWKVVFRTGADGDNIPNLAFSDDENGDAKKVVAVDVSGNIWLMDIWDLNEPMVKIPRLHGLFPDGSSRRRFLDQIERPRGWGVLVVKESSFLPVNDYRDSLGLDDGDYKFTRSEIFGRWIDTSRSVKNVPNNSLLSPWLGIRGADTFAVRQHEEALDLEPWFGNASGAKASTISEAGALRSERTSRDPVLDDGSSILRFYETDVELRSFEEGGIGIMCQHATRQARPPFPPTIIPPALHWLHERLSNVLHVPELSLVVAGSMSGRIALITLSRPRIDPLRLARGFRIEAFLPTKKEEDTGLRPLCPLFGIAIAPLPRDEVGLPVGPRRYRLMIHYYDLRILSYEVSRDLSSGMLEVA